MPHQLPVPGTIVSIRRRRWRIAHASPVGGATRIEAVPLDAADAGDAVTFFAPFDRITGGRTSCRPRRVRGQRWRAALSGLRARAEHVDLPLAALDADITLLPHQLEPAFAIRHGARRLLIADAVGLGKTIQAGLIAADLARRGEAARSLILTPAHLCLQWRNELAARFGLVARLANASTLADLAADLPRATSPWSLGGIWIASADFIKQPHVRLAMPWLPWDLVVIDEAHMVAGPSDRHAAVDQITRNARRVLLLTATPFSGLDDGHALSDLGTLGADDDLVVFRRTRADIGMTTRRRTRTLTIGPAPEERRMFDVLHGFERAAGRAATVETADATRLLLSVLRKRALSTPTALALSATRRLAHLDEGPSDAPEPQQAMFDFGDDDGGALRVGIGLPNERERVWMRRLLAAASAAARASRKIRRVADLLTRTNEPAIVFTEYRDSLEAVASALHRRHCATAIAHGGLSAGELMRALASFTSGDVRLLLATDVASQGLNLHQRARWVIHLDVPWNPMRLEQRAGRVDRLGQRRDIHVTRVVLALEEDATFSARIDHRTAIAAAMTLTSSTRWRRRGRAAAIVLDRRRQLARQWRGPLPLGRPLAARGARHDVRTLDIGGAETVVLGGDMDAHATARLAARRRRVSRLVRDRSRRAIATERALLDGLTSHGAPNAETGTQAPLPGAVPATVTRAADAARAAKASAVDDITRRIIALDAASHAIGVVTTRRLTRG